ncbi:MAG: Adaptive-response sensory-kinase SasA [Elusimicrobia bacterium]|nr:Adaptive-response sensory-kinase SasA [Elusimicrobiota bacterium]
MVVIFTGITTILTLRRFIRGEIENSQLAQFNNFLNACSDALYLGDNLAIQAASESLEKAIPELAYAVFVDDSRNGIQLGGIESVQRIKRLRPVCPERDRKGQLPLKFDASSGDSSWRHFCLPIQEVNLRGERVSGTVHLGFNLNMVNSKVDGFIERIWPHLLGGMLVALVLGLFMAFIIAKKITRPIAQLTEGAKAIGEGHWETRIPVESSDELGFLAHEFNLMSTKLKELDDLKDDFVSSVSHELRSPLSAISGYAELLRMKPLEEMAPEKREKALVIIQESTERLSHFINDILDLAKIKSGQIEVTRKPFSIKATVEEVVRLFQPLIEKKNIQCFVDISEAIPMIQADGEKIRQVITNLISNALKFTPSQGKIRIIAKNQTDSIHVLVEDSGVGIPEDQQEIVFEKFRQVKGQAAALVSQKGTGLGLAIAKGNIEAHGGKIWIESDIGKGTKVHFTLPMTGVEQWPKNES